ncbi:hypothetical protein [Azospirillum sp. SYSU D00513]|uniref:hypothetical protein n=1 Tax=Azospirillum sp. SYSU D00513 TaxID=2812561 RepID=UPI001A968ACC|nr:hypothetical protein [Azospirillum sp. SYSU D00513]
MSADRLFEYEETLRQGGAPNAEVFTKALRIALDAQTEQKAAMQTEISHLNDRFDALDRKVDALDRRVDALDRKIDKVEASLSHRIDMVEMQVGKQLEVLEASIKGEIQSMGLQMTKMMTDQIWKTLGVTGAMIGILYFIEKFV